MGMGGGRGGKGGEGRWKKGRRKSSANPAALPIGSNGEERELGVRENTPLSNRMRTSVRRGRRLKDKLDTRKGLVPVKLAHSNSAHQTIYLV